MSRTYEEELEIYLQNKPSNHLEFYFLHYENVGELIGKYKYKPSIVYDEDQDLWVKIPEETDHADFTDYDAMYFPKLYKQDNVRIRPVLYEGESTRFLKSNSRWLDNVNYVPYVRVIHHDENFGLTTIKGIDKIELHGKIEVNFGDFYLLTNSYRSIKRINLASELMQNEFNSNAFKNLTNKFDMPKDDYNHKDNHFIKWYFGYSESPDSQRPPHLTDFDLSPNINNIVHSESRRRWNSLNSDCLSWVRIYDKTNLNILLSNQKNKPQSTSCTIKCVIDYDELHTFLDASFKSDDYEDEFKCYDLLLHPPSIYMYPSDAVTEIIEPRVNSVADFSDKVVFELPRTFKSDGNFQYRIEFFLNESSKVPVFSTSSAAEDEEYEPGNWFYSVDEQSSWETVSSSKPTFDNKYETDNGVEALSTTHIKYDFSDVIFEIVKDNPTIIFKIHQIDGTLVHFNAYRFTSTFEIEI
ncbi:hypothetical protein N9242_00855 [Vicingaceae bacterium]|nr:hypothetical protein [Vicingaceae bacterium]